MFYVQKKGNVCLSSLEKTKMKQLSLLSSYASVLEAFLGLHGFLSHVVLPDVTTWWQRTVVFPHGLRLGRKKAASHPPPSGLQLSSPVEAGGGGFLPVRALFWGGGGGT